MPPWDWPHSCTRAATRGFLRDWYRHCDKAFVADKNRAWLRNIDYLLHVKPHARLLICVRELDQIYGSVDAQHQRTILIDFTVQRVDWIATSSARVRNGSTRNSCACGHTRATATIGTSTPRRQRASFIEPAAHGIPMRIQGEIEKTYPWFYRHFYPGWRQQAESAQERRHSSNTASAVRMI